MKINTAALERSGRARINLLRNQDRKVSAETQNRNATNALVKRWALRPRCPPLPLAETDATPPPDVGYDPATIARVPPCEWALMRNRFGELEPVSHVQHIPGHEAVETQRSASSHGDQMDPSYILRINFHCNRSLWSLLEMAAHS